MAKYIWYSGATDKTGQAIADALNGVTGSRNRPRNLVAGDILIGWGTKTSENVTFRNGVHLLNHPNKIRANRNKLTALDKMSRNRDLTTNIAQYCLANQVLRELGKRNATIKLPLVGRTKYHQGGKGFWLCLTQQHIQKAIDDGAAYFQNYVDISDEYRLHVAFGSVIHAVKKIENATEAGWKAQRKEKILDYSQKNNWNLDDNTIDRALSVLFKEATLPDRIVRSNKRGWKFSSVRLNNVSAALKNAAIRAVEVMELDFGAVDCAMGSGANPYIIEINSGPGLQGTALEQYVTAFGAKIREIENPKPSVAKKAAKAVKKAVAGKGVGAALADKSTGKGMAKIMQNVRNDEEARAVIEALMAEQRGG